jgi:hypothetical protein
VKPRKMTRPRPPKGCRAIGEKKKKKILRCFKLRLNRKLYVKCHADKLNVGDLFLRVLKCFSCLSEGRKIDRKKERKKERKKS